MHALLAQVALLEFPPHCYFCFLLPLFQQKLNLEQETIELVHTKATEIADLPRRIPQDSARYHFFLYKHSHEGDYLESVGKL